MSKGGAGGAAVGVGDDEAGGEQRGDVPHVLRMGLVDDMHLHLRDGDGLEDVARRAYRERILSASDGALRKRGFQPLMTLYLTDDTTAAEIDAAVESGVVFAVKLYPAGATTNSASGVTDVRKAFPALQRMAELGLPLCVHGEVTDPAVDVFDREEVFLSSVLPTVVDAFPKLKVVVEHCTTKAAVEFVRDAGPNVAATITPQHLLYDRNAMLVGGLKPHLYCLPVLKSSDNQAALRQAVQSGSPKFFLGSDSAPHARQRKEASCCSAGCYSSPLTLEYYAEVFDDLGCIDLLPAFATHHAADFYGLPRSAAGENGECVEIERAGGDDEEGYEVPGSFPFGADGTEVVPLMAGERLHWRARRVDA